MGPQDLKIDAEARCFLQGREVVQAQRRYHGSTIWSLGLHCHFLCSYNTSMPGMFKYLSTFFGSGSLISTKPYRELIPAIFWRSKRMAHKRLTPLVFVLQFLPRLEELKESEEKYMHRKSRTRRPNLSNLMLRSVGTPARTPNSKTCQEGRDCVLIPQIAAGISLYSPFT